MLINANSVNVREENWGQYTHFSFRSESDNKIGILSPDYWPGFSFLNGEKRTVSYNQETVC